MVDRYHLEVKKDDILYATYIGNSIITDSAQVDRNRKSIGLPTMKHNKKMTKDFFRSLKIENKETSANIVLYQYISTIPFNKDIFNLKTQLGRT